MTGEHQTRWRSGHACAARAAALLLSLASSALAGDSPASPPDRPASAPGDSPNLRKGPIGTPTGGNLASDDPAWPALLDAIATGSISDPLGGVQSLPAARAAALIAEAQASAAKQPLAGGAVAGGALLPGDGGDGPWVTPLLLVTLRAGAASVEARPYSTPVHPRQLAGAVDLSCEHQQGRPCGDGAGAMLELDSAAGVGSWLTLASRVRAVAGSQAYAPALELDRAFLRLAWGPLSAQLGRDVFALGPSVRSATAVSDHAAPQDGLRLQLSPVALPFAPEVKISLLYFIDRLRDPQTFHGTLVDCTRVQFDLFDRVQLGGSRLLQFGGDGAPDYGGLWGWFTEHLGRNGSGTEENNRLELDLSVRFPWFFGARVYYELDYEDTRSPAINSFIHDPDHLLGAELRALALGPLRRLFLELEKTSWLSQEHGTFQTGMTNLGRPLGTPLGPDTLSLWARADLALPGPGPGALLSPWFEWLRASSSLWAETQEAGVFLVHQGVYEHRQRLGLALSLQPRPGWTVSAELFGERVANAAFVEGASRLNGGARVAVALRP